MNILQSPPTIYEKGCAALKRFGFFKPESDCRMRKAGIVGKVSLEEAWGAFDYEQATHNHLGDPLYYKIAEVARKMRFGPSDIEDFSISMVRHQDEGLFSSKAGIFLSAFINESKGSSYTIHTRQISKEVDYLGHNLRKKVVVDGPIGSFAGLRMVSGRLIIDGDSGVCVGQDMSGGRIIVAGNTGMWVGSGMRGGKILIEGNALEEAGHRMSGGALRIKGICGKQAGCSMTGGEIRLDGGFAPGVHPMICDRPIVFPKPGERPVIYSDATDCGVRTPEVTHGRIFVSGRLVVDK